MINPDRIGHAVLKVRDLERSRRFYTEVMGLEVMAEVPQMRMVFLASHRRDHHELALYEVGAEAPAAGRASVGLLHLAFRLPDENELRRAYQTLRDAGVPILGSVDHGISKSIYFLDPDGIQLEVYCDNPPEAYASMANPYAGRKPLELASAPAK